VCGTRFVDRQDLNVADNNFVSARGTVIGEASTATAAAAIIIIVGERYLWAAEAPLRPPALGNGRIREVRIRGAERKVACSGIVSGRESGGGEGGILYGFRIMGERERERMKKKLSMETNVFKGRREVKRRRKKKNTCSFKQHIFLRQGFFFKF